MSVYVYVHVRTTCILMHMLVHACGLHVYTHMYMLVHACEECMYIHVHACEDCMYMLVHACEDCMYIHVHVSTCMWTTSGASKVLFVRPQN